MQMTRLPEAEQDFLRQVISDKEAIVVNRAQALNLAQNVREELIVKPKGILTVIARTLGGERTVFLLANSARTLLEDLESGLNEDADDALSFFDVHAVESTGAIKTIELILLQA